MSGSDVWIFEQTGPTVYRSKTVFEDATPELVRDFFWDDDFRPKWDPMLAHCKVLEECSHNGTTIVHWIKKVFRLNILVTVIFGAHWYGSLTLSVYSSPFSVVIENIL